MIVNNNDYFDLYVCTNLIIYVIALQENIFFTRAVFVVN